MRHLLLLSALAGCAHAVPPAAVSRTAPPRAEKAGSVCWIEYARSGPFTASGVAVRTDAGVVLVDAGQSRAFREEIGEIGEGRAYLRLVPGRLTPDAPASGALAAAGIDPNEIVAFVPTHAHSDHVGGLMDLPDLPVRMHPEELALLERVRDGGASFNVIPAQARRIVPEAEPVTLDESPYQVFSRRADLLGDGSVVLVPLSGHTPGSVGVFVELEGVRLLYAGDAINTRAQLDRLRGKGPLLRRTDADREAADGQVAVLAALHEADPDLRILPAHERRAWIALFGEPGGCVPGR